MVNVRLVERVAHEIDLKTGWQDWQIQNFELIVSACGIKFSQRRAATHPWLVSNKGHTVSLLQVVALAIIPAWELVAASGLTGAALLTMRQFLH